VVLLNDTCSKKVPLLSAPAHRRRERSRADILLSPSGSCSRHRGPALAIGVLLSQSGSSPRADGLFVARASCQRAHASSWHGHLARGPTRPARRNSPSSAYRLLPLVTPRACGPVLWYTPHRRRGGGTKGAAKRRQRTQQPGTAPPKLPQKPRPPQKEPEKNELTVPLLPSLAYRLQLRDSGDRQGHSILACHCRGGSRTAPTAAPEGAEPGSFVAEGIDLGRFHTKIE